LLITVSFFSGGPARRDKTDYLIFAFFANGVDHEQRCHTSDQTERLPAELSRFVDAVLLEEGTRIRKDVHGVLKANTVLPLVDPRLHKVPTRTGSFLSPSITPNM
jgi:hypothetical protein